MRLAYISFDTVPAPKGAAIHIAAFTRALARAFGSVELVTVSSAEIPTPPTERYPGVFHTELPGRGVSLIDRVLCFRACLERWLSIRRFDLIQFRSIFEGFPLLSLHPRPRLIFEVNGLPSIELKHRYPRVADDRELMRKLIAQEQACLEAADRIVTPSAVTERYLAASRGVDPSKIRVIPNGVDTELFHPRDWQAENPPQADGTPHEAAGTARPTTEGVAPALVAQAVPPAYPDSFSAPDGYGVVSLLYFGTLAHWQGVDLAVRAVAQICQQTPARLTILGVGSGRQREAIAALAAKLGIAERVAIGPPVSQPELVQALHRSFAVLAPLAINDRNTVQGCCPLKILEGMAAGIPVIASDLPVVRELGDHGRHFLLVKPGSVDQIAQAVLLLRTAPDLVSRLSEGAREHIVTHYPWEVSGAALAAVYEELGISLASSA
ncbi:MAG TPA: glycosyltransferase family 4 protein [Bryobacteraceae bacterium]|nr:glycosyltransferase family 4 protein [Bryobacteraceae bacterium]